MAIRTPENISSSPCVFELRVSGQGDKGASLTAKDPQSRNLLKSLPSEWANLPPEILGEISLRTKREGFLGLRKTKVGSLHPEDNKQETVLNSRLIIINAVAQYLRLQGHEIVTVQGRIFEAKEI